MGRSENKGYPTSIPRRPKYQNLLNNRRVKKKSIRSNRHLSKNIEKHKVGKTNIPKYIPQSVPKSIPNVYPTVYLKRSIPGDSVYEMAHICI